MSGYLETSGSRVYPTLKLCTEAVTGKTRENPSIIWGSEAARECVSDENRGPWDKILDQFSLVWGVYRPL